MFNLNIPSTSSLLSVDSSGLCSTPKTPEIVNSLIAMTNPLDNYTFTTTTIPSAQAQSPNNGCNNHQIISQDSSHSSCSGSPLESPVGTNTTPSVQQTCSQLIKAGLKLSIQSKRKMSSGDSSSGNEQPANKYARKSITGDTSEEDTENRKSPKTGLTPEDEDRRRRRRERNKIAATKCRMKKRERTLNLVNESEQLETQNMDLRTQVRNLETERRKLFDMLQTHVSACVHPRGYHPPAHLCQSPACKYLNDLGMCDQQQSTDQQQQQQQQQHSMQDAQQQQQRQQQQQQQQQQQRTAIPPMTTIKYSRNGIRHNSQTTNDILSNGYCKPSPPPTHELSYLNSPTQDVNCLHSAQQQQQQQHQQQSTQQQQHQHQQQQHHHQHIHDTILKIDYIPTCENSNGGTTVDSNTTDFVLKNELNDAQSPYTTAQSAERFLFETNCENYDIKHSNNNNNNNNSNNNNNTIDFHTQLTASSINCQTYDNLLIKNDFLPNDTELLTQLADGTESEFTDLDSGVTTYLHLTNGGCLA